MTNFERSLYADPDADLDTLWWDLVERYQLVRRPDGRHAPDWAAKIHLAAAPVYYQNYLYGELFASQLDATLAARTGGLVDRRAAGALLRDDVFAPGASLRWDELVERATGEPLTAAHLARQLADGRRGHAETRPSDGPRTAGTRRGRRGRDPRRRAAPPRSSSPPRAPRRGARAHPEPPARGRGGAARRGARTPSGSSATCSTPARSRPRSRSSTSAGASATRW